MKRIALLFLTTLLLVSCSTDDDNNIDHDYHLEYIAVDSVDVPGVFMFGRTYRINVTVQLPNSCYFQYGQFDYFYEGTTRLIYPIAHVDDGVSCDQAVRQATFSIPVTASQTEPYLFKFYQGEDTNGEDVFLTVEVLVI